MKGRKRRKAQKHLVRSAPFLLQSQPVFYSLLRRLSFLGSQQVDETKNGPTDDEPDEGIT